MTKPAKPKKRPIGTGTRTHVEDDGGIPAFLLVKNRKPLTAEQQKNVDAFMAAGGGYTTRVDHRKPKGLSWEEWDAHLEADIAAKREKSLERVAELKEKYKKPPRIPKPKREDAFQPNQVIRILVDKNPCRAGAAAHTVFEKYRTGMTVAQFTKAAQGVCPGKLRPIDYLIYDSRKGRISVGLAPMRKAQATNIVNADAGGNAAKAPRKKKGKRS